MTGVGGERKTEQGIPRHTDIQANAGFPQKTETRIHGRRERQNHNRYRDRKSTGKLRAKARTALPGIRAPHRSVRVGWEGSDGQAAHYLGRRGTIPRSESSGAARGRWRGLAEERDLSSRNLSPLRGPRLRAPSLLLAITPVRLPLGRKPLGSSGPAPAAFVLASQGPDRAPTELRPRWPRLCLGER